MIDDTESATEPSDEAPTAREAYAFVVSIVSMIVPLIERLEKAVVAFEARTRKPTCRCAVPRPLPLSEGFVCADCGRGWSPPDRREEPWA